MFTDNSVECIKLSELEVGGSAVVVSVSDKSNLNGRLMDLGISPSAKIECVACAPSGAPRAYRARSTTMALRNIDADTVIVRML